MSCLCWQASPQESLTSYERQKEARVASNKSRLAELQLPEAAAALFADKRGQKRGKAGAAPVPEATSPSKSANTLASKDLPPHEESGNEDELIPDVVAQAMLPEPSGQASGSRHHAAGGTRSGVHAHKAQRGQQACGATGSGRGRGTTTRAGSRQTGNVRAQGM